MNVYMVKFRAARRRTSGVASGMRIWVKPFDAVLTRNLDVHPEARVLYVGEVEAPDADNAVTALNICYESVVLLKCVKLPKRKGPTKRVHPEVPTDN